MNNIKSVWYIKLFKFVLPFLIIAAGAFSAKYLYDTRPVAERIKPVIPPPLVETISLKSIDHNVVLSAMGRVTASKTIALKARVAGFVTETSSEFLPGGIYREGDMILKLDQSDFQLAVKQQEATLSKSEASLKLEMGKQEVAKAELRLMQHTSTRPLGDPELALRKPQLEQIKAEIASIKVDLEKARLNLKRTVVRAPFNCMVIETSVERGSQVSSQDTLVTLSGTDEYRVEAAVPADQLGWIIFPPETGISSVAGDRKSKEKDSRGSGRAKGSDVVITTGEGVKKEGEVIRLLGNLSDQSRLARVLIRIKDPLSLGDERKNPLLLGSYVKAEIEGRVLENVFPVPRSSLRDGSTIWIADDDKNGERKILSGSEDGVESRRLIIKKVDVLWKESRFVFVRDDIISGMELVVSELPSPVDGMTLKVESAMNGYGDKHSSGVDAAEAGSRAGDSPDKASGERG